MGKYFNFTPAMLHVLNALMLMLLYLKLFNFQYGFEGFSEILLPGFFAIYTLGALFGLKK